MEENISNFKTLLRVDVKVDELKENLARLDWLDNALAKVSMLEEKKSLSLKTDNLMSELRDEFEVLTSLTDKTDKQ